MICGNEYATISSRKMNGSRKLDFTTNNSKMKATSEALVKQTSNDWSKFCTVQTEYLIVNTETTKY